MRKFTVVALAVALACLAMNVETAEAGGRKARANRWGARFAQTMPWHGDYYHTNYGVPVALVVPPTANMQTHYSWGVSQNTMTPIYHQFARPYVGQGEYDGMIDYGTGGMFRPTPPWPSHTDQFGVYYVRGPW